MAAGLVNHLHANSLLHLSDLPSTIFYTILYYTKLDKRNFITKL